MDCLSIISVCAPVAVLLLLSVFFPVYKRGTLNCWVCSASVTGDHACVQEVLWRWLTDIYRRWCCFAAAQVSQRADAMSEINKAVQEVAGIFSDLAMIVHEQGDMVESIAGNVEQAVSGAAVVLCISIESCLLQETPATTAAPLQNTPATRICSFVGFCSARLSTSALLLFYSFFGCLSL